MTDVLWCPGCGWVITKHQRQMERVDFSCWRCKQFRHSEFLSYGDAKMQIDVENPNQLLSHFLLNDRGLVEAVLETKEWKEEGKLTPTVLINGVEISSESFEKTLRGLLSQVEERVRKKYGADDIDARVREQVESEVNRRVSDFRQEMAEKLETFFLEF